MVSITTTGRRARRPFRLRVGAVRALATGILMATTASGCVLRVTAAGDLGGSASANSPVAKQIAGLKPTWVMIPGDVVMPDGQPSGYSGFFEQTYGPLRATIVATPGNHDYHTAGAAGVFGYFHQPAYFGKDLGNGWRAEVVNCEITCGAGSAQEQAIKADAIAHRTQHLILLVHRPRFTGGSSHGPYTALTAIWNDVAANGGELAVSGHNHVYERFARMNGAGTRTASGMRQFVAGTGAGGLYTVTPVAGEEAYQFAKHGVLVLELSTDRYTWKFVATDGQVMDSGTQVTKPAP
jgi:hypothetical protein